MTSSFKCIYNGANTTVLLHPLKHLSFHVFIVLRDWLCHNSSYILQLKQWISVLCTVIAKKLFSFNLLKVKIFWILHMLRIHTGLRKLSKTNAYELHLKLMNSFYTSKPCINIANIEVLFEQYRMAINRGKYDIEVWDDDSIKRNRIFFDFI